MKHAGTVFFKKYNEGDDFCNIFMPNDTLLILVKIPPYFQFINYVLGTSGPLLVHYATAVRGHAQAEGHLKSPELIHPIVGR